MAFDSLHMGLKIALFGNTEYVTYGGQLRSFICTPYLRRCKTKKSPQMMHNV